MNKKNQSIGFDFDKVFINYPPFIPDFLIDRLYRKRGDTLAYRIPGKKEQFIRILSHYHLLRPAIKNNILQLEKLQHQNIAELFLISSRFGFLKKQTDTLLKKYGLTQYFKQIFFNFNNEQPHIFKNKIIQKLHIEKYIDDDLDTLRFLSEKNPTKQFYWLIKKSFFLSSKLPKNVTPILNLEEFRRKHI